MKTLILKTAIIFLCITFAGCSKSGDGLSSLSNTFIPDFSNTWTKVKGNANTLSTFFMDTSNINKSKGTGLLIGSNTNGVTRDSFSGSFTNTQVTIKYYDTKAGGPNAGITYKGIYDTFIKPNYMRLLNTAANSTDSLVIKHG